MPDQLQLRGGTTAEHSTFTGAIKEVTVDTTKKTAVVHDGTTAGGVPLLRQDGSNSALALGSEGTPSLKWDANTGIFSPGEDQLAFVTNANRAITITSTQAVGIKTANPSTALHVAGSTRVGANSAADAFLEIGKGATGDRNSYIDIVADTTYTDYGLRVIRNNTGFNATSEIKHRGTGNLNFTTQEAGAIVFNTTNSPRVTITSGGNVGIGTASPAARLEITGGASSTLFASTVLKINGNFGLANQNHGMAFSVNNNGPAAGMYFVAAGLEGALAFTTTSDWDSATPTQNERLRIAAGGTITFNAYGAGTLSTSASGVISASDGRYKTKTRQLGNALEAIAALEPTYYRWNEGSPFESKYEELGFVAQEVAVVIPEASPGEDEEGKYRNYHDRAIIAMLVKGMQEQQSIITALTARVAALEAN